MRQSIPGVVSSCSRGESRYKSTVLELPEVFSFQNLVMSSPPEASEVLDAVSVICYDCGQEKVGSLPDAANQNYCSECYEEKVQSQPPWVSMLHQH